ncbi:hypothetical protein [Sulfurimonas sp.]|uniref:hypothetical protein n=1 Tax=Sulfurimonas sp. TaxID=2022749 RepID=UPI00262B0440|nr:hypothetical protein [Sulfurimonas sp.]
MNRINPIHIAILLVVILLFSILKLNAAKEELSLAKSSYKETLALAVKLDGLKRNYFDKMKVQNELGRILRKPALRSANIVKKVSKSSIILSSQNIDLKALNTLLGKVLNATFYISELKIKRLSEKNASLKMEIKW